MQGKRRRAMSAPAAPLAPTSSTIPAPLPATPQGVDALPFDVLLTTYTMYEREGVAYSIDRQFLKKWPWSNVVGVLGTLHSQACL